MTFSGANTYSGGTTVSAGVLQGTTTSLQRAITNNASVIFDQTTTGTYSSVMSGSSSLTKSNTGTVTLSGTNTYTGNTNIDGGVLSYSALANIGASNSITIAGGTLHRQLLRRSVLLPFGLRPPSSNTLRNPILNQYSHNPWYNKWGQVRRRIIREPQSSRARTPTVERRPSAVED